MAAVGSQEHVLLTTEGMWVWGSPDQALSNVLTGGARNDFRKVNLPADLNPADVVSMTATKGGTALLMKEGTVRVAIVSSTAFSNTGVGAISLAGAGAITRPPNFVQVMLDAATPLTGITDMIFSGSTGGFAYSALNNTFYTWGPRTYLGDGTAMAERHFATPMVNPLPAGVTPVKLVASVATYLILGSDGLVYSLGDWPGIGGTSGSTTATKSTTWTFVRNEDNTGPIEGVTYIDGASSYNGNNYSMLVDTPTMKGRLLSWGGDSLSMMALGGANTFVPTRPFGDVDREIFAVENGGHFTPILYADCAGTIGNTGHNPGGAFGDGTTTDRTSYAALLFLGDLTTTCHPDADGDGIPNSLELDSDNDGCSDVVEAGPGGFDYDRFALSACVTVCADTDGDGVPDINDADADNDGIPNAIESPGAFYTAQQAIESLKISSTLTTPDDNQADGDIQQLHDGLFANTFNFSGSQPMSNRELFRLTYDLPVPLTDVTIVSTMSLGSGVTATLQGSNDGVTWTELSNSPVSLATTTDKVLPVEQNSGSFRFFRIQTGTNTALTSSTATIRQVTATMAASYDPSLNPNGNCSGDDADGMPNWRDTDSDGDGCFDAIEGGAVTASSVASYDAATGTFTGTYGSNGLADVLETSADTGLVTYTSTYHLYARDPGLKACTDTDADGIADVADIDADNDGIPNAVESPGCFFSAEEANTIARITSSLVSIDDDQKDGDIQLLHDGSASAIFNFNTGQSLFNAEIYRLEYPTFVNLASVTVSGAAFSSSAAAKLQGSIDGVNWLDLTTSNVSLATGSSKVFTVAQNAAEYRFYRVLGTTGINTASSQTVNEITSVLAAGYDPNLHPKSACLTDTDGDGKANHLDTDSDGDGCSDAVEAGAVTPANASSYDPATGTFNGPYGSNGLTDVLETSADSGAVNYTNTYDHYALNADIKACLDNDGDGVRDLQDIDDDNDGIPDTIESPNCFFSATEANTIVRITSGLTSPDDDQSDGDIQLLHDGSPTATFNFDGTQDLYNAVIYRLEYPTFVNLTSVTVTGAAFGSGTTAKLQGSTNGITWFDLTTSNVSLATTAAKVFTVGQNAAEYRYYQVVGTSYTTTATSYTVNEITSVLAAGYDMQAHPKSACLTDTDGDGKANHLDTDSDGDGCSDAAEAGALTAGNLASFDMSSGSFTGAVGTNGLVDILETTADSGTINYTSTYSTNALDPDVYTCPITVNSVEVGEADGYAVFTLTGNPGRPFTLSLGNDGNAATADATIGTDTGSTLEYFDGTDWVPYTTNSTLTIPAEGTLQVRVAIIDDTAVESTETVLLTVTPDTGFASTGTATILDNDVASEIPALAVSSPTVNEASPYAVFEVTGEPGQAAVLSVTGNPLLTGIEYFNGTAWVPYDSANPPLLLDDGSETGALLVRVDIEPERDSTSEGSETFTLVAATTDGTASTGGVGTIRDDGVGDIFLASNTTGEPDDPNAPGYVGPALDDDRPAILPTITVDDVTADNILNAAEAGGSVTITGTTTGTEEGDTVTLTINGVQYTGTVAADGTYSIPVPGAALAADPDAAIDASVSAAGGTAGTATKPYSVDTTPPAVPTVDSQTTNDSTPTVTGAVTLGEGETLAVTIDGTTYTTENGLVVDPVAGTWSVTLPETTDGTYPVVATVTDAAGNSTSDVGTDELTIDTTPPVTPTVDSQTTNDSTPTVTGTVTLGEGETLAVTIDGTTYTTANGLTVDPEAGTWSVTLPETTDGTYEVAAVVTDAAGNATGDASTNELTVDTTPPTPTITIDDVTADNILNAAEAGGDVSITGTTTGTEEGDTVTLTVNDETFTGTVDENGDFSIDVPGADLAADVDVTIDGSVSTTDAAGNTGTATDTHVYTVDTEAPAPTIVIDPVTADNVVNIAESEGTVTITGSTTGTMEGDEVTLTINGVDYTGTVAADGTYSIPVPGADLAADPDVTIAASVSSTDAAGNTGTATDTQAYSVDTTAPAPTISIDDVTADNILNAAEAGETITITGSTTGAEEGDTVTLTINGVEYTGTVANDGTYSIPVPGADLAVDSDVTIATSVSTTDAAGNTGTATDTQPYTVDTTPPALTVTTVGEDTGASSTDKITNDDTLTITGTTEPGAEVEIFADGASLGTVTAGPDGSYTFTTTPLPDAEYELTVTATDAAGNTTDPVPAGTWTVDTAVEIAITTIAGDDVTGSDTSGLYDATERANGPVVISGTTDAEPGQTVVLTINGKNYSTTVEADGTWEVTLTVPDSLALNHGSTYGITASVQDLAGNTAVSAGEVTLDVIIATPDVPTVDNLSTASATPILSGSAQKIDPSTPGEYLPLEDGDTIAITLDGVTVTATIDLSEPTGTDTPGVTYDSVTHTWTLDTATAGAFDLADDTYDVGVVVTSGPNSEADISAGELVVNSEPPTITIDPISTDNLINAAEKNQSVTLSGTTTAEVGATVTLTGPDGISYTATVLAGLNGEPNYYTVTVPSTVVAAFTDGDKTLNASVTNEFGLTGTAERPYAVDGTPPAAPVISLAEDNVGPITDDVLDDGLTDDNLPLLVITAEPGTTVNVYSGGDLLGTATEDPATHGTYSLQLTTPLADGPHSFVAVATDDAGNTSPNSASFDLTVDTTPPTPTITIDDVTADNILNAAEAGETITITGSTTGTQEGDTVTLTINGNTYTGTVAADLSYSIGVPGADLATDPNLTIDGSVSTTDEAGNTGTATDTQVYSVDTEAPTPTITIDDVTADNILNAAEAGGSVTITGTTTGTQEGDTVTLTINGNTYTGTVAADLSYSIAVPGSDLAADTDVTIDALVSTTDEAGNTGTATDTQLYAVDTEAPVPTIVIDPVTPDNVLNIAESEGPVTITGTTTGTAEGDEVTLTINGVDYTGTVDASGTFSIDVEGSDLTADSGIVGSVTTTDEAGNTGTGTGSQPYSVDLEAPTPTLTIDDVTADNILNAAEAGETITVTGSSTGTEDGDTVTLTVNGKPFTGTVDADGNFSIEVPGTDLAADADVTIDGSVSTTDEAGNTATATDTQLYAVDTEAPVPTMVIDPVTPDNVVNIAESEGTVTITGSTTETTEGDIVTLTINGVDYTGPVNADGTFSIEVEGSDLSADSGIDGSVTATDEAGNTGTATDSQPYSVDLEAPTPTITIDDVTADNILNAAEAGETITITGTTTGTQAGDTVTLTINGQTFTGTVAADLSYSIDVPGVDLAADSDATIDASVSTTDAAGNTGTATDTQTYAVAADLAVTSPEVNEGSPFVIFAVTGNPGQEVSLAVADGTADGDDYGPALEYYDGTEWVAYVADALVQLDESGTLLVRTAITNDSDAEGGHTFTLTATSDGTEPATGTATILDDGTGDLFSGENTTGSHDHLGDADDLPSALDDDRPLSVDSIEVNEGSPFGVFTVKSALTDPTAAEGQRVSLSLTAGSATTDDFGPAFEYFDGTTWQPYNDGDLVALDENGEVLVRVAIVNDETAEGSHSFTLTAANTGGTEVTGTGTILDDGTGGYWIEDATTPATPAELTAAEIELDDDRVLTVSDVEVNEGSPFAIFTVTGGAGQLVALALADGSATGDDYGPALEYFDGSAWVAYNTGDLIPLSEEGELLVRTAITNDEPLENAHEFTLTATSTSGGEAVGAGTILDDGTGDLFSAENTTGTPDAPGSQSDLPEELDDDRPLTVSDVEVNEGSPFAIFTVTGGAGQLVTLSLTDGSATSADYGPALEYFDGAAWVAYNTGDLVPLNEEGELLVRTAITNDEPLENAHEFTLTATSTGGGEAVGTGTILDDGTGELFSVDNTTGTADAPGSQSDLPEELDDDRPLSVSDVEVNEGSPFAIFTVTGGAGQLVALALTDGSATGDDYGPALEYFDGSAWVAYNTGDLVPLSEEGELLVRTAITNDGPLENAHEFTLTATSTGGGEAVGTGTILDDGTGNLFSAENTTGTPDAPGSQSDLPEELDDDRPLTVSDVEVNEGSPFAIFTVTGGAGQLVTLSLTDGSATSADYGPALEYFDGSAWVAYNTGDLVRLNEEGELLVRTAITNDEPLENAHEFTLTATSTSGGEAVGTGTILDDGTGEIFLASNTTSTPNQPGDPGFPAALDDDRPYDLSVTITDGRDSYVAGGEAVYTITVTNTGPGTATGARVVSGLPESIASAQWTATYSPGATGATAGSSTATSALDTLITIPAGGSVTFTVRAPIDQDAVSLITMGVTVAGSDPTKELNPADNTASDANYRPLMSVGTDVDCHSSPVVTAMDPVTGAEIGQFMAFEPGFRGGIQTLIADVNHDGTPEVIAAPGIGRVGEIRVFTLDGQPLPYGFMPYGPGFLGGINFDVGDVDGDGIDDLVTAEARGAGRVAVFRGLGTGGWSPTPTTMFNPFGNTYRNGVSVALADVATYRNGTLTDANAVDGKHEIVVGTGSGTAPVVKVFDVSSSPKVVKNITPFTPTFRGGVTVSAGRYDADASDDIIVSGGRKPGSQTQIFSGTPGSSNAPLITYNNGSSNSDSNAPTHVTGVDTNGDGRIDSILSLQGAAASGGIRVVDRTTGAVTNTVTQLRAPLSRATVSNAPSASQTWGPTRAPLVTMPSGLQIVDVVVGQGGAPTVGSPVTIHVVGSTQNGEVFANTRTAGQPLRITLQEGATSTDGRITLVRGLIEALLSMQPGGRRVAYVPANLAFGDSPSDSSDPAGLLVFDIELISIG